jgi:hypothetical protein
MATPADSSIEPFAQVRISFITDTRLTANARLLGIYWADKPAGWKINAADACAQLGFAHDAYKKAVACLKNHGCAVDGALVRDPQGRTRRQPPAINPEPIIADSDVHPGHTAETRVFPGRTKGGVPNPGIQTLVSHPVNHTENHTDNHKAPTERASRRGRANRTTATLPDLRKISIIVKAATLRGWVSDEIDDEDALDVWARFIGGRKDTRPIRDYIKYFYSPANDTGVFATFEYWDGVLSNTPDRESA